MMVTYPVNEIFTSVQGEGVLTGTPATFIRLQGCPVGCPWCDSGPLADDIKGRMTNGLTRNTWGAGGTKMTLDEIVRLVDRDHVIITGGEPVIHNLDPLLLDLHSRGYFTQLETSGWGELKGQIVPRHITISPKPNLQFKVPNKLGFHASEIKFVVDEVLTFETVLNLWHYLVVRKSGPPPVFSLMPEGCPPGPNMIAKTLEFINRAADQRDGTDWHFSDRLQYRIGVR